MLQWELLGLPHIKTRFEGARPPPFSRQAFKSQAQAEADSPPPLPRYSENRTSGPSENAGGWGRTAHATRDVGVSIFHPFEFGVASGSICQWGQMKNWHPSFERRNSGLISNAV
jgi:hypothetical protein